MREIKFRSWDGEDKVMTTMDNFVFYEDNPSDNEKVGQFFNWHYGCEIMQYTGLKDKNGVEIYEGDIVKETVLKVASRNGEGVGKYHMSEVKFNPYFGFSGVGRIDRIERGIDELEVIGNIYENPELLKDIKCS